MRITALEYDIFWKHPAKNCQLIEGLCQNINADLLVLPEMFNTGFCMEKTEITQMAEDAHGPSFQFLQQLSANKNMAVVASMAFVEDGQYYNRLFFVFPDGHYQYYNKRHLFAFAGEDKIFSKGQARCIVEYLGWRIKLQICYDLRFPVFARNQQDYDLLIYVANWPARRQLAWDTLLPARAIENQAYVLGLNRCGTDGLGLDYQGHSQLIAFDGQKLAEVENGLIQTELHLEDLRNFRQQFPFLEDADGFLLS
jgi:omega-amidase